MFSIYLKAKVTKVKAKIHIFCILRNLQGVPEKKTDFDCSVYDKDMQFLASSPADNFLLDAENRFFLYLEAAEILTF